MMLLLMVCLVSSPLVFGVADTQKFLLQPRDTTAVRGETVTLYCAVDSGDGAQFVWIKDGAVITRGFTVLVSDDPHRLSIGTMTSGTYNLVITDSRAEDSGAYRCVVTTGGTGLISETGVLQVWAPPAAEYPVCGSGAGSQEVAVGERLPITCDVEGGNPRPELYLKKGDVSVQAVTTPTGIRYDWTVSEADESAEFICIGTQRFWAEPRTCRVGPFTIVSGPPTLSLSPPEARVHGGKSASFLCTAQSAPRPVYRWFVGGVEVVDGEGGPAHTSQQTIGSSSVLLVHDVGNEDETLQIMCIVDSATGTVSANAVMHVVPVYSAVTETASPPEKEPSGTGNSGSDSNGRGTTENAGDTDGVDTGEPEIFESGSLAVTIGAAAGGVVILVLLLIIVGAVLKRRSSDNYNASKSTEKLAEAAVAAPEDGDVYYRSRFVGAARSWLFPVHKDTKKGITASMQAK